jgi:hypothetical protein
MPLNFWATLFEPKADLSATFQSICAFRPLLLPECTSSNIECAVATVVQDEKPFRSILLQKLGQFIIKSTFGIFTWNREFLNIGISFIEVIGIPEDLSKLNQLLVETGIYTILANKEDMDLVVSSLGCCDRGISS